MVVCVGILDAPDKLTPLSKTILFVSFSIKYFEDPDKFSNLDGDCMDVSLSDNFPCGPGGTVDVGYKEKI